jgi:hypothetical protein
MNKLIISLELVQALVDYLQQRPFIEVYQLINALTELKKYDAQNNEG